jgi:hypothetical protein
MFGFFAFANVTSVMPLNTHWLLPAVTELRALIILSFTMAPKL